ncbi:DUF4153 domain-containing protein [Streptomyces sp. NPDC058268]|uniref:DUF4153 domain-containing protein n=1 Tax=Streptomyces sp. NPDC058268 TaxID=3346413 RepID=UPI0036E6B65E
MPSAARADRPGGGPVSDAPSTPSAPEPSDGPGPDAPAPRGSAGEPLRRPRGDAGGGDSDDDREAPGEPQDAVPGPRAAAGNPPAPRPDWAYPGGGYKHEPLLADLRADPPAPIRTGTLGAVFATGLLSMLLLGDGLAINLLIVALPAALAAYFAAEQAGRRLRPWTLTWAIGGLALLAVPALRDAGWPSFLALVSAVALGSLALHGCRTWPGVLLAPVGLFEAVLSGLGWGWRGVRGRASGSRSGPVLRAAAVTVVLLLVFGALFAGADAAFAGLLGDLMPDASVAEGPWRLLLFALGVVGALAAAHTAAAPVRWDRLVVGPGRERGRVEWALPLIVLNLLFAAFNVVQLAVLFGGYDAVLEKTDLSYSAYARQGFWQLLLATLLTLVVIVLALRWAPRDGARDRSLVRAVLGTLCALTLVVVASAVRRMDMYVEAYGLTRLRVSVVAVELWLGLVIVLIMAAGVWGARWLPRAVAASAAAGVLAFGLLSPDALIAERNVQRYEDTGKFDLEYARGLSADAAPDVDGLPEPLRSCALEGIAEGLGSERGPWYATSLGEARAREIMEDRPPTASSADCMGVGEETAYR